MTKSTKTTKRTSNLKPQAKVQPKKGAPRKRTRASETKRKAERAPVQSAVNGEDVLAAVAGKAPRGNTLRVLYLQWLAAGSREFSEAYVDSLRRPVGEFIDWCAGRNVTTLDQVTDRLLAAFRRSARTGASGEPRAISTLRMSLARVQTFLRAQDTELDLSVLRVTVAEELAAA